MVTYIEYRFTQENLDSDVDVGLCSRVLLELMPDLHGHHLYTDNYYTSPKVFLALYDKGINYCGTVQVNRRGIPKQLVKNKRKIEVSMIIVLIDHSLLQFGMTDDMFIFCPHYT